VKDFLKLALFSVLGSSNRFYFDAETDLVAIPSALGLSVWR